MYSLSHRLSELLEIIRVLLQQAEGAQLYQTPGCVPWCIDAVSYVVGKHQPCETAPCYRRTGGIPVQAQQDGQCASCQRGCSSAVSSEGAHGAECHRRQPRARSQTHRESAAGRKRIVHSSDGPLALGLLLHGCLYCHKRWK